MIQPDQRAREDEEWIGELNDREASEIAGVDEVGYNAEEG